MSDAVTARLAVLPATFTTSEAEHAGVWRRELYRLRDEGKVLPLARGVFRKADAAETAHLDLLAVTRRAPQAVVCLVSALALHDLTDEIPFAVHIAVPRGTHRPRINYPKAEVAEFDVDTFELGRQEFEVSVGEKIPVYSAARTVADVMRLRTKVGEAVALSALRGYLKRRDAHPAELLAFARVLDVEGPVRRAVEAVMS